MPIDYSKWDHLDDYSSSGSEDGNNAPRVTQLDAPSSVTFGGTNMATPEVTIAPSKTTQSKDTKSTLTDVTLPKVLESTSITKSTRASANNSSSSKKAATAPSEAIPDSWTERGGKHTLTKESGSGATSGRTLYWSQDRYSVYLRLELASSSNEEQEKIHSVAVEGALPYSERNVGLSGDKTRNPSLVVWKQAPARSSGALSSDAQKGELLLKEDLPHLVHYAENEEEIDWTVVTIGQRQRYLSLTIHKAVPMVGMVLWWNRPFLSIPEGDVPKREPSAASKDFMEAWNEAHRLFLEKKREPPMELNITEDTED